MSAHCHACESDMGIGPDSVPVCAYCEVKADRERLADWIEEYVPGAQVIRLVSGRWYVVA